MSDLFSDNITHRTGNPTVDFIIDGFVNEHAEDFDYLLREWNPKIREYIRSKTGLRLGNEKSTNSQIPVKIVADRDNRFSEIIDSKYPGLNLFEFIALRNFLESSEKSKQFLTVNKINTESLNSLTKYAEDRVSRYDLKKISVELFRVLLVEQNVTKNKTMDILGTYFGNDRKIEIYYVPIILFSEIFNMRKDCVFRLVLCHELSHAYHHSGKDGDKIIWDNYFSADLRITEGLAEFYTLWFAEKNSEYSRHDLDVFKIMASFFDPDSPYVSYRQWKNISSFESLRDVLYVTRRNGITNYDEFMRVIKDSSCRL